MVQKLFENWDLIFCLIVTFLNALQTPSGGLFLQFASRRLHWPLAKAGYLLSVKVLALPSFLMLPYYVNHGLCDPQALISLVVLCVLPAFTRSLEVRRSRHSIFVDLTVIRSSLFLMATGSFIMGWSQNTPVLILGRESEMGDCRHANGGLDRPGHLSYWSKRFSSHARPRCIFR